MDAENFFSRWSRRKAQVRQEHQEQQEKRQPKLEEAQVADDAIEQSAHQQPAPTMEEVAALTPESDFRRFLVQGVAPDVRRAAMKKMFTDPHFNVMDGLDIYIADYNKFTPLPDEMLAALNHAQGVLNPQPLFDTTPEKVLEDTGHDPGAEGKTIAAESVSMPDAEDDAGTAVPPAAATEQNAERNGTEVQTPDQHTENPEGHSDHGNQIPGM